MFPTNRKIHGYLFGVPTFYSNFHLGVDYGYEGDNIFAPFDGLVQTLWGVQGGHTIHFTPNSQDVLIRFLHLQQFKKTGQVKEGDLIGIVGHTGLVSPPTATSGHCHLDISKHSLQLNNTSNFLDPEKFAWKTIMPIQYPLRIKATVVINGPVWSSITSKLAEINAWYAQYSGARIQFDFTVKYSSFTSDQIKEGIRFLPDGSAIIYDPWFNANVLDLTADTTVFVVSDADLPDTFPGGQKLLGRTNSFMGKKPTSTIVACAENDMSEAGYPTLNAFYDYVRHELMHTCYAFSGGADGTGFDYTHNYFFVPPQGSGQPEGAFNQLNYENINITLKGVNMVPFIKKTLNLDGAIGVFIAAADSPAHDPSILQDLNSIFGTNLQLQPGGAIPTDVTAHHV